MSVLNKTPFIKTLLASLTPVEVGTLANLIDGKGDRTAILRTLNRTETSTRTHFTSSDKGVKLCNLEFNYSLYDGYLIYNDNYCVLISYTDSQKLMMFSLDLSNLNLNVINEELSVLELRSELDDTNQSEEAEINQIVSEGLPYLTTAPTSANTNGKLIPVVLSSEPATKYSGYLYFIVEA